MGVNNYFGPRWTNRPHATPNYRPVKAKVKFIITDRQIVLQKNISYKKKTRKFRPISNVLF